MVVAARLGNEGVGRDAPPEKPELRHNHPINAMPKNAAMASSTNGSDRIALLAARLASSIAGETRDSAETSRSILFPAALPR
ncbi:MAG: hypothetical protein R3C40_00160 [Parvularculaceae bacterium]